MSLINTGIFKLYQKSPTAENEPPKVPLKLDEEDSQSSEQGTGDVPAPEKTAEQAAAEQKEAVTIRVTGHPGQTITEALNAMFVMESYQNQLSVKLDDDAQKILQKAIDVKNAAESQMAGGAQETPRDLTRPIDQAADDIDLEIVGIDSEKLTTADVVELQNTISKNPDKVYVIGMESISSVTRAMSSLAVLETIHPGRVIVASRPTKIQAAIQRIQASKKHHG